MILVLFEILFKILTINLIFILPTVAVEKDDEACRVLKKEFEEICFSSTHAAALVETETFCSAFKQTCAHIVDVQTLLSRTVQNRRYCKKYREVFQFVCPEPTRFGKYSNDAMSFCPRYQTRCPNEPLPSQPLEPQKIIKKCQTFYGLGGYGLSGYEMGSYGMGGYGMGYGGGCCMGSMGSMYGMNYGMGYGMGYGGYGGGCCGGYYG
uniref:DUF19 domain-containing protein n=1 Tax=Strongyloides stercoralis TaxID=6248 RepID=A0AAF5DS63_STRER